MANVLFHVVNERFLHHRPINKPLSAWGRVLHDPDLAQAILDRVLERGRHLVNYWVTLTVIRMPEFVGRIAPLAAALVRPEITFDPSYSQVV